MERSSPERGGSSSRLDRSTAQDMSPRTPRLLLGGHIAPFGAPDTPCLREANTDAITVLGDTRQLSQADPRPEAFPPQLSDGPLPLPWPSSEGEAVTTRVTGVAPAADDPLLSFTGASFSADDGRIDDACQSPVIWPELESRIHSVLKVSKWDEDSTVKGEFLSLDDLDRFINKSLVRSVVRNLPGCVDVEQTTNDIWEPTNVSSLPSPQNTQGEADMSTRRRLFLLLLMADKAYKILYLIDEGVYDRDLPFTWDSGECRRREGPDGVAGPVNCLSGEREVVRSFFATWQWKTLAPFLSLSTDDQPKVYHYPLHGDVPLPFIRTETPQLGVPHSHGISGGFSVVRRVAIEPSHFNRRDFEARPGTEHPLFAVKTLCHNTTEAQFEEETLALKRMMTEPNKPHTHRSLVRLLATIKHGRQYHMIFPWADGNLYEFWEKYGELDSLPRGVELTRWVAWELLGLTEAMGRVHHSAVPKGNPQNIKEERLKIHGCHGDIKPQNILVFLRNDKGGGHPANLQLADFGFARFHRKESVRIPVESAGLTETYRSPEFDIEPLIPQDVITVGPKTDIWSFGAVVLEFITWYFEGWPGVLSFTEARTEEDIAISRPGTPPIQHDKFFNRTGPTTRHESGLRVKHSVTAKIGSLRSNPRCSKYFHDLLDYIEYGLLVAKEDQRASCDEVRTRFHAIYDNCNRLPGYCTERGAPGALIGNPASLELPSLGRLEQPTKKEEVQPPLPSRRSRTDHAAAVMQPPAQPDEVRRLRRKSSDDIGHEERGRKRARRGM